MDVKNYLISTHGLSIEEAAVIADNPKYSAIYEKAAREAEDGKTALLKAQEVEKSLKDWNATQVVPYVQKADKAVADAQAKIAAQATYLKTLKDQGYDIPDSYLDGAAPSAAVTPAKVEPVANAKNDDLLNFAKANMALISMSNRYRKLTGGEELDPEAEYTDFGQNARPNENLRTYISRKYDLDAKEAAKSAEAKAAERKAIEDAAGAKAIAEYQAKHGSNGETRIPQASKFAEIAAQRKEGGGDKLWQTKAGRDEATNRRLEKYAGKIM